MSHSREIREKVEVCRAIGNELFKENDFCAAYRYYIEGLRFASDHPQLNVNASVTAFKIGLIGDSEKHAVRAFNCLKDYEKAYFRAIKAAEERGDLERQIDYFLLGMENCNSYDSLVNEGLRINKTLQMKPPLYWKGTQGPMKVSKLIAFDEMMIKVQARKVLLAKSKSAATLSRPLPVDDGDDHDDGEEEEEKAPGNRKSVAAYNKMSQVQESPVKASVQFVRPPAEPSKENAGASDESGRPSVQKARPPFSVAGKAAGVPRDKSNQRTAKKQRTGSIGPDRDSAKDQGSKQTQEAQPVPIYEEIKTSLKNGREAFKNSFYPVSITYLTKAQTALKENSLEDMQEFALFKVPLNYVICEAKVCSGEYKELEEAICTLKKIIEDEGSRKFPAAVFLLGLAYLKLNRFKEARKQLEKVNALLKGNVNFNTYPWPGTFDVIDATRKVYLETAVRDSLRQCGSYQKPNWICIFDECENHSTHIIPSRKIYFNDPDFTGYVELTCSTKCSLVFHHHCWKVYKEQHAIKRLTDKAILGEPCITPDCQSPITGIAKFDKDGKATHRDSIPFEPPTKKQAFANSKSTDSPVPKQANTSKRKKQKSASVPGTAPPQKPAHLIKKVGEEVTTGHIEEKETDFEIELKNRKIKLDYIRRTDQRWAHFNLDAPTSQVELTEEEKFVESFFEEVLKTSGPSYLSSVENCYKENRVLLEEANPSLYTFHNLVEFLLNRSQRFVLMDSILGLAADVVEVYRRAKERVNYRVKIPSAKKLQDSGTVKTAIPPSCPKIPSGDSTVAKTTIPIRDSAVKTTIPTRDAAVKATVPIGNSVAVPWTVPMEDSAVETTIPALENSIKMPVPTKGSAVKTSISCRDDPTAAERLIPYVKNSPEPDLGRSVSPVLANSIGIKPLPFRTVSPVTKPTAATDKQSSSKKFLPTVAPLTTTQQASEDAMQRARKLAAQLEILPLNKEVPENEVPEEEVPEKEVPEEKVPGKEVPEKEFPEKEVPAGSLKPANQPLLYETSTSPLKDCVRTFIQTFVQNRERQARNNVLASSECGADGASVDSLKPPTNSAPSRSSSISFPDSTQSRSSSDASSERLVSADKPSAMSSPSSGVSSAENKKSLSEGGDSEVSIDDLLSYNTDTSSGISVKENTEVSGDQIVALSSFETPGKADTHKTLIQLDEDAMLVDLPAVEPEHEPKSSVFNPEVNLVEDSPPFEDLFVIENAYPIGDIPVLDLPPVDTLVWDLKDLPSNGDLFAIDTELSIPDDLFQVSVAKVPTERSFPGDFGALKSPGEPLWGKTEEVLPLANPAFDKEDLYSSDDVKCSNRWKPRQDHIDFIRLSFPRENYSRLIEGLGIIYEKKGLEINKMSAEDIVKDLAGIFELNPCIPDSNDGADYSDIAGQQLCKEDEISGDNNRPWKPPIPLVQMVRLSFPTEEFYKLMFALYIAKVYSDFTQFEDLCNRVAIALNEINEGNCQDYNYELSTHGAYNEESRTIYKKAWEKLIADYEEKAYYP